MRFRYIKEHRDSLNIKKACKILNVSRAGYYKYLSHKPSARDIENQVISEEIKKIFEEHKGRYDSLRISKVLENQGLKVNRKRVSRLMRLMGLCPKATRYKYKKYNQKNNHEDYPNLLNQIFKAEGKKFIKSTDLCVY